jgi:ADP-dependent NAD(P)H-hydrate dehydratase / NAD(P)H-hydrate epimerase
MQRLSSTSAWPVYDRASLRALETQLQARSPTPLMEKAGLAAARLALALAPHAQRIWVAAGPGNNGGDGLEAAMHLHRWGKTVQVSLMGSPSRLPADAHAAWQRAQSAGVPITPDLPTAWLKKMGPMDLCIDALLGIGATRSLGTEMQTWVQAINQCPAQVLAIDLPTGLNPETGQLLGDACNPSWWVQADHTLTFIAAKACLFMGHGRDACGDIWLDPLGLQANETTPTPQALLNTGRSRQPPTHASHKGSHGDVAVIGGEPMSAGGMGMTGAAVLAATAALHAGAGRVILSLLSGQATDSAPPDVMQQNWEHLDLEKLHVVCGCGGGQAVHTRLPEVLQRAAQLVLDADGLNAVARDSQLQALLRQRALPRPTVITPHPLEAARLLKSSTAQVQGNRLQAAQDLVNLFQCTVVLKGSGTVIATPGQTPRINTTGNGRLAIGGTGDVLAGLIGTRMAQGLSPFDAACSAVAQHGQLANDWPQNRALTANRLAQHLR